MFQIPKVQNVPLALEGAVAPVKGPDQMHQAPLDLHALFPVLIDFPGALGKNLLLGLQFPLEIVPHSLHRIPGIRVNVLGGEPQGGVFQGHPLAHLVPGGALPQVSGLVQSLGQIFADLGPVPAEAQAPLQIGNAPVQPGKQVFHQHPAPQGLPRVLRRLGRQFQAPVQPALRVRMAPGLFVDLEDDLLQLGIVPAQALAVGKGTEVCILLQGLVGGIQQSLQGLSLKLCGSGFIRHPEIPVQPQPVGILPEQITAKAVNRGDFR